MAVLDTEQPSLVAAKSTGPKPDRRSEILAAAESCFARSGFHQASMNDICQEAGMSPGNLYRYFPSKEAIIEGIAERNRAQAAESFAVVEHASSFFEGLAQVAHHYFVERPDQEVALCTEIMAESRRNPAVTKVFMSIEGDIHERLAAMLKSAAERGEIAANIDFDKCAQMLMVVADGMTWRRACDPNFNVTEALPLMFRMIRALLTDDAAPIAAPAAQENQP